MYTEICAEVGETIAAASSTPGIQLHLILSLLGKHDSGPQKAIYRIVDLISALIQVTFGHPLYASIRTPTGRYQIAVISLALKISEKGEEKAQSTDNACRSA
jgi:hypothetical protein